jgi:hypothetical protein
MRTVSPAIRRCPLQCGRRRRPSRTSSLSIALRPSDKGAQERSFGIEPSGLIRCSVVEPHDLPGSGILHSAQWSSTLLEHFFTSCSDYAVQYVSYLPASANCKVHDLFQAACVHPILQHAHAHLFARSKGRDCEIR